MLSHRVNVRTSKFWRKSKETKRKFFRKFTKGIQGFDLGKKKFKNISCLCTFKGDLNCNSGSPPFMAAVVGFQRPSTIKELQGFQGTWRMLSPDPPGHGAGTVTAIGVSAARRRSQGQGKASASQLAHPEQAANLSLAVE
jgi:hypothetical protein